jgi:hypothetical protein
MCQVLVLDVAAFFKITLCENGNNKLASLSPATVQTSDRLPLTVTTPMQLFPVITLNLFLTVFCYD